MYKIIKIKRLDYAKDLPLPKYETSGSAGMDLYAAIKNRTTIKRGEYNLIHTG